MLQCAHLRRLRKEEVELKLDSSFQNKLRRNVLRCNNCKHDAQHLWVCLSPSCTFMGCGRTENEHAAQHYTSTTHPLAVNLKTKMVWCYACDIFLEELALPATEQQVLISIHQAVNPPALVDYPDEELLPSLVLQNSDRSDFLEALESGRFSDVTVVVNGEPVQAHKLILYTAADFFKMYFDFHSRHDASSSMMTDSDSFAHGSLEGSYSPLDRSDNFFKTEIELDGFPGGAKVFKQLLRYMYGGEIEVETKDAFALLSGAMQLLVKGNIITTTKGLLLQYLRQNKIIDPILFLRQMLECNLLDDEMLDVAAVVIADELERHWKTRDPSFLEALDENNASAMISFSAQNGDNEEESLVEKLGEDGEEEIKPERGFAVWAWLGLPFAVGSSVLKKLRTTELITKCAWKYIYESLCHSGIAPEDQQQQQQQPLETLGVEGVLPAAAATPMTTTALPQGLRCEEVLTLLKMMRGSPSLDGLFFLLHHALKFESKELIEHCLMGIATRFGSVDERNLGEKETERGTGKEKEKEQKEEGKSSGKGGEGYEAFYIQIEKLTESYGRPMVHKLVCDIMRQECLGVASENQVLHFIMGYLAKAIGHTEGEEVEELWGTLRPSLCDEEGWKEMEDESVPLSVLRKKEEDLREIKEKPVQLLHTLSAVRKAFGMRSHQQISRLSTEVREVVSRHFKGEGIQEARTFLGHARKIQTMQFISSDLLVTTALESKVNIWQLSTGECLHSLIHPDWVRAPVGVFSEEFIVTGCDDCSLRVWNTNSGQVVYCQEATHRRAVKDILAFSTSAIKKDERLLVSISATYLVVQKFIFTLNKGGQIIAPVRHVKIVNEIHRDSDYFQRIFIEGSYLFAALQSDPWLVRYKQNFLFNKSESDKRSFTEVKDMRRLVGLFGIDETLLLATSANSVWVLENLDILNQPEEIVLGVEVSCVCQVLEDKQRERKWFTVLLGMKNGWIYRLLVSKKRKQGLVWLKPRKWKIEKDFFQLPSAVMDIRTLAQAGKPHMVICCCQDGKLVQLDYEGRQLLPRNYTPHGDNPIHCVASNEKWLCTTSQDNRISLYATQE